MDKKIKKNIKSYAIIVFGLFIQALAWTAFLIPSKVVGGGVTGIASLLFYASKEFGFCACNLQTNGDVVNSLIGFACNNIVGISVLIMNTVLILWAIKKLGASFGVKTVIGIAVLAGFIVLLQPLTPDPIVKEKFMSAILGGILGGVSLGMIFAQGGSTGGTDIIAMLFTQKYNVSPGKVILYCDVLIIASSCFVFSKDEALEALVYGYVTMGITSYALDMVVMGAQQSVQFFIISRQGDQIAERIGNDVKRGVTMMKAQGWYSKEDINVLMCIVRKHEAPHVYEMIKDVDPDAFLSESNVMGVYGKGFDRMRG